MFRLINLPISKELRRNSCPKEILYQKMLKITKMNWIELRNMWMICMLDALKHVTISLKMSNFGLNTGMVK